MLLGGQVFNAQADQESHDDGPEFSANVSATDDEDWKGQSVDVVGARVVDVQGQVHRLGVTSGVAPFVIVFIGEQCPISTRYVPELNRFGTLARDSGLTMYGVISDPFMSVTEARAFVAEYGLDFSVLWDPSGDLAHRLKPTITPEVFVISPKGSVLYRGRIDNRFASLGVLRNQITSHDLRDAIAAVSRGGKMTPRRTQPVGCYFEAWDETLPEAITYNRDIAPIVNANCAECHRDGGVAPFPLETYAQVKRRARMVSYVTETGVMPPWRAEKGYGSFRDERHLSERQIGLLTAWAEAGVPAGDEAEAFPSPIWAAPDWQLGEPDLVVEMAQAFEIPAEGEDIYRYFVVPFELHQGRAIVGAEFRPGDPAVVHHSSVYFDYSGRARRKDAQDDAYGFSLFGTGGFFASGSDRAKYIYGWVPGLDPLVLPPDRGVSLPGESGDAVFEIHYRPNGMATADRSRMALYFADGPVSSWVGTFVAGTLDVNIAPEDGDYWRQVYVDVPADIELISVSPHMHYLGREVKAVATLPDGSQIPLIYIPDWDFRWQNIYIYREPLALPAGSRIDAWFKFDNSSENPYNPHIPPGHVGWGWSSDEEMCEIWIRFVPADESDRGRVIEAGNRSWSRRAAVAKPPPN